MAKEEALEQEQGIATEETSEINWQEFADSLKRAPKSNFDQMIDLVDEATNDFRQMSEAVREIDALQRKIVNLEELLRNKKLEVARRQNISLQIQEINKECNNLNQVVAHYREATLNSFRRVKQLGWQVETGPRFPRLLWQFLRKEWQRSLDQIKAARQEAQSLSFAFQLTETGMENLDLQRLYHAIEEAHKMHSQHAWEGAIAKAKYAKFLAYEGKKALGEIKGVENQLLDAIHKNPRKNFDKVERLIGKAKGCFENGYFTVNRKQYASGKRGARDFTAMARKAIVEIINDDNGRQQHYNRQHGRGGGDNRRQNPRR